MRRGLVALILLAGCGETEVGSSLLDAYKTPVQDLEGHIPGRVMVCFALQTSHLAGEREDGLEQDIAVTCDRTAQDSKLSSECRAYAGVAADYGRAVLFSDDTDELVRKSNTAFARCRT